MIKTLKLIPFNQKQKNIDGLHTSVTFIEDYVFLSYILSGNLNLLKDISNNNFNEKSIKNNRKDELWKHTCFEFFLLNEDKSYTEINISQNAYNIYAFDDYRQGMKQKNNYYLKKLQILKSKWQLKLDAIIRLDKKLFDNIKAINISSILEFKNKEKQFWALKHKKNQPDFHDFELFLTL